MVEDLYFLDQQMALLQAQQQRRIQDDVGTRFQYCYYEGELSDNLLENFIRVRQDEFVDFFANNQLPIPGAIIDQQGNRIDIRRQMPDIIEEIEQFRAIVKIEDYSHQDGDYFDALEALNIAKQRNPVRCGASLSGLQICYHHDPRFADKLENLIFVGIDELLSFFVYTRLRIPKQLKADLALNNDYHKILQAALHTRAELVKELAQEVSEQAPEFNQTPLRVMIVGGRFSYAEEDDLQETLSSSLRDCFEVSGFEVLYYCESSAMESFNAVDFLQHYQQFKPHILVQFNRLYNHFLHPDVINLVYWTGLTQQLKFAESLPFRKNDFNLSASSDVVQHLKRCGAEHSFQEIPERFPSLYCCLPEVLKLQPIQLRENLFLESSEPEPLIQRFHENMKYLEKQRPMFHRWLLEQLDGRSLIIKLGEEIDGIVFDIQIWDEHRRIYQLNNTQLFKNQTEINTSPADAAWLLTEIGTAYELHWIWDKTQQAFKDCLEMEVPIYLITQQAEHFLLCSLLHDWSSIIESGRLRLFYGEQALEKLTEELENLYMSIPRRILCPSGGSQKNHEKIIEHVQYLANTREKQYQTDLDEINAYYKEISKSQWKNKLQPQNIANLKVLGITSRFTTFLQFCMRDWLDGFERLGAQTECYIESENYQRGCLQQLISQINRFKPDLILNIDHFRHELSGIPENIPYICWIQDRLPNITGNTQSMGFYDFTYVFAKRWLAMNDEEAFKQYPVEFLPIGVNESLYKPMEGEKKLCDILFVTHLVDPELTFAPVREPETFEIRWTQRELKILNRGEITEKDLLDVYGKIDQYTKKLNIQEYNDFCFRNPELTLDILCSEADISRDKYSLEVLELFKATVDNRFHYEALTRLKQWPIQMLINQNKVIKIHLYGKNWQRYSQFRPFWKGIAENGDVLNKLMNQSRICLNASPGSTMHMRAVEIIASGAFMLTRRNPADSSSIWEYFSEDEVIGFNDTEELLEKVEYYIDKDEERQEVAKKARRKLLKQFSYKGIARKLVNDVQRRY